MFWVQRLAMEMFPGTGEEEGWMVGELVKAKGICCIGNTHKETLSQSSDDPPHSTWRGDVITKGFPNLSTHAELL